MKLSVMAANGRESHIDQTGGTGKTFRVPFRNGYVDPETKLLPLTLPIYRMANMRTSVLQRAYIGAHNVSDDYFAKGQEDPSVQLVQHRFLVDLSKESTANIYKRFEESAEQIGPLVITGKGIILNGNRRLAAMRALYDANPVKYSRFAHVEVAVLPKDANEDDLTAIETEIQIAPELKLEYGWVEQAIGLQRQIEDLGWDLTRAAKSWREPEKDLKARLEHLRLADEYLTEYLRKPGEYGQVQNHEQALKTFSSRQAPRSASADPSRVEAERYILFSVLANPDVATGRTYDFARDMERISEQLIEQLDGEAPADSPEEDDWDDPLGGLPSGSGFVRPGMLAYLRDANNGNHTADVATDILEDLRARDRAGKKGKAVVEAASRIHSAASNIVVASADPTTVNSAAVQLVGGIAATVQKLRELLTAHPSTVRHIDQVRLNQAVGTLLEIQKLSDES